MKELLVAYRRRGELLQDTMVRESTAANRAAAATADASPAASAKLQSANRELRTKLVHTEERLRKSEALVAKLRGKDSDVRAAVCCTAVCCALCAGGLCDETASQCLMPHILHTCR